MKPSSVVVSAVFALIVLVGVVWVGRYPKVKVVGPHAEVKEVAGPPISSTGPYPKAAVDAVEYHFGVMAMNNEGTHTFTIRNEGEADLVLMAREDDRTCQCTAANLSTKDPIPPGKSAEVTLHWHIRAKVSQFRHSATIRTNDPKNKAIKFEITGTVEDALVLKPENQWEAGVLADKEPTVINGTLHSPLLDEFTIEKFECENPAVTVTWEPLSDAEKADLLAKSGYNVKLTLSPTVAIGTFSEKVKLITSVAENKEVDFKVNGSRPGPVDFYGPNYRKEVSGLMLGEFPAHEGKESTLVIFFRDFDEEVKLLKAEQTYNSVELDFQPAGAANGSTRRYLLKVKVPPGGPQNRQRKNAEKIDLHFNHPAAEKVRIAIDFLATEPAQ